MELLSLEINVLDYVEENRKEELERALKSVSGRNEIPEVKTQGGMVGPFFYTQSWGNIKDESLEEFEQVNIHVLRCQTLPFMHIVVISAKINKNLLVVITKGEIKIEDIRKKFEAWTKLIFDKISGIISRDRKNMAVFGKSSITAASLKCEDKGMEVQSELRRKMLDSGLKDAELEQLSNIIRKEETVFRNVGVYCGGIISVTYLANNYISFVGQSNTIVNAPEYSHDDYAVVEFGSDVRLSEYVQKFPTSSSYTVSHQLSRLAILQMLVFWLRSKLILYNNLKEKMKELQTKAFESEAKEVSKIHQKLWQGENEFLKEYSDFSDAMNYIQDYLKFERMIQKDQFHKEISLPTEYLVSSETGKPAVWGVFDIITGDIEGGSSRVMNFYTLLKGQYSIVSGNLRDRINISLATSNMKLQKQLVIYTFILVILTVVLLLKGFGWIK